MGWPGEKVLTRVIDALERGVGGYLLPWQIRRVGRANAEARVAERLLLEQAELDIAALRAGRKRLDEKGNLIDCAPPPPLLLEGPMQPENRADSDAPPNTLGFVQAVQSTMLADEFQRAVNLKKVALYAEEEAEEIDSSSNETVASEDDEPVRVDDDWLAKWRTAAQDVSREEMQRLWGKLLAGEVAHPGTYSLHTIDFMSRMSSSDADLLARVAPFATSAGIVRVGNEFFAKKGVTFQDLLDLDDINVINGAVGIGGLSYTLHSVQHDGHLISTLLGGKNVLIFDMGVSTASPSPLTFEVYAITRVGRELLSLASIPTDLEYLLAIAELSLTRGIHEVKMGTLHPDGKQIMWPRTLVKKPDLS